MNNIIISENTIREDIETAAAALEEDNILIISPDTARAEFIAECLETACYYLENDIDRPHIPNCLDIVYDTAKLYGFINE